MIYYTTVTFKKMPYESMEYSFTNKSGKTVNGFVINVSQAMQTLRVRCHRTGRIYDLKYELNAG